MKKPTRSKEERWAFATLLAILALVILAICIDFFLSIATTGNITNLQLPTL